MRLLLFLFSLFFMNPGPANFSFREKQMVYTRVRESYAAKEKILINTLADHSISREKIRIYFRAFKTEKKVELWAKNSSDFSYKLIKEFPICEISGTIGPKRRSRDLQVPEGFYHISNLNPYSKYYLSMQINYPNASDSIRGFQRHLGNLIFIHGGCESSGCLAMTDEWIKEIFIYCIEAYNSGQDQIDFTIFPAKMDARNYSDLTARYRNEKDELSLWADLKKAYDQFEQLKVAPVVKFLPDGTHQIQQPDLVRHPVPSDSLMFRCNPALLKTKPVSNSVGNEKCEGLRFKSGDAVAH